MARARVPASTANLGPGYDVLALALSLYCEVTISPAVSLVITAEGEGSDLPRGPEHLAAVVARQVLGHNDVAIHVRSDIPVGRGLGSSAALAIAAAAAAGAPPDRLLEIGCAADGHAENAAASLLGSLVAATVADGVPLARRLPLDGTLGFVVLVPDRQLATKQARSVLPDTLSRDDAVFNLGRMGLLCAGLADASALVSEAGADRLHQDARAALFPEAPGLLGALRQAGAVVATWSGAGPSMLGICRSTADAEAVRAAGEAALEAVGVPGRALILRPDTEGLVVTP